MKILTVIPIAKGIPRDELSYFSAREVGLGTLVTVPFGGRKIKGVVVDAREVRDLKSSIKNESYALKNISEIHTDSILPNSVFQAAQMTARFYSARIGAVLETVLPKVVFEAYVTQTALDSGLRRNDEQSGNRGAFASDVSARVASDVAAIQIAFAERVTIYKTMIRENMAREKSTMIICSTVAETDRLAEVLKTGIEERIFAFHSKKTKIYFKKNTDRVLTNKEPCVVVATAPFASLVRNDWHDVIIERCSSASYRYNFGPVFDLRYFVEHQARAVGARLMFADTLLPTEIRNRITNREIYEMRNTWHISKPDQFQIIDEKPDTTNLAQKQITKDLAKSLDERKPFSSLSDETQKMISIAPTNAKILLITSRKGLAPLTVCSDCGTVVSCPNCETPLVLHRTKQKNTTHPLTDTRFARIDSRNERESPSNRGGKAPENSTVSKNTLGQAITSSAPVRTYLCHHCGFQTPPTDFCATCMGHRLATLGISTDRIAQDAKEIFPNLPLFILEKDSDESISKTLKSWNENGGILVTTPSLLPAISGADFGCIVSLDSLLSIPTYTSGENSLIAILQFLEKIKTAAIIQTRNINHSVIQSIASDNLFDFMQNELKLRAQFNYPPIKTLVKITLEVLQSEAQDAARYFETIFQAYDPDIMIKRALKPTHINVTTIIKLDTTTWNDFSSPIHEIIDSLPDHCRKEINPDSVI